MAEITARMPVHINLGSFEWVEIDRTLTGIPDGTPAGEIHARLLKLMAPGFKAAQDATLYGSGDNETSVYEWNNMTGGS